MTAVYSFFFAVMTAAALVPLLARAAIPLGLVDRPNARKIHREVVPRVGGIAVVTGVLVALALWAPSSPILDAYLVGAGLIAVFGVLDDRFDLGFRLKFAAQFAAALTVIVWGDLSITRVPFFPDASFPSWVSLPLTAVAIVGVTNALNLADGLDGLAGGIALLVVGALGALAYAAGDETGTLAAVCIAGATLGFLRYNTTPARVFLGDSGSQFLGFSVAVLAIYLVERANTAISPLVPLVALAIPVMDTLVVMGIRIANGRPPFMPDRHHLHHRLLDRGLTQQEAVLVIYLMQTLMSVLAWRFAYWSSAVLLGIFAAISLALFGGLYLAERRGIRWPHSDEQPSLIVRARRFAGQRGGVARWVEWCLGLTIPVFFLSSALLVDAVARDIGVLASILLIGWAGSWVIPLIPAAFIVRLAAFVVAVTAPYLLHMAASLGAGMRPLLHAFFALIVLGIAVCIRFGRERRLAISTLDWLVVIVVGLMPQLPALRDNGYGIVAIEALILFYASDLLLEARNSAVPHLFKAGLLGALAVLAVRGLWP